MQQERLTYTIEVPKARIELVDGRTFDCTEPMTLTLLGAEKQYSVADFISPVLDKVLPPADRVKVGKIVAKATINGGMDFDLRTGVRAIYQADYVIWSRAIGAILVEDLSQTVSFKDGQQLESTVLELHLHPRLEA